MTFMQARNKVNWGEQIVHTSPHNGIKTYVTTKMDYLYSHEDLNVHRLFSNNWEPAVNGVEVTIDGKTGHISKESAEELKKMLT